MNTDTTNNDLHLYLLKEEKTYGKKYRSYLENFKTIKLLYSRNWRRTRKETLHPRTHGSATRRVKQSNYGLQKAEKQKMRQMYGLSEKQFYNTYVKAVKKKGVTGTNLFIMLESRLDNLVYRMGFASTRKQARQIVSHGHVLVDGKKLDIPSCQIKPGQVIEIKDNYKNNTFVAESLEATTSFKDFVEVDKDARKGKYVRYPERKELNQEINELLVIEYYNR